MSRHPFGYHEARRLGFVLLAIVAMTTGCSSVYTGIQREADGSYYVTRTKQGFFSTHGTLYRCQVVNPQSMRCAEIDTP